MTNNPLPEFAANSNPQRETALAAATRALYDNLRGLARGQVGNGRDRASLEPTELVHECFLRLSRAAEFEFLGRGEFLALASKVLRQVLSDHARAQNRLKRGEGWQRVTLHGALLADRGTDIDLVDLDDALTALAQLDPRQARIVELRFLGGLQMDEIASLLGVPRPTVEDDWAMARAWLRRELRG